MNDHNTNKNQITLYAGLKGYNLSLNERIVLCAITQVNIYVGGYMFIRNIVNMGHTNYLKAVKSLLDKKLIEGYHNDNLKKVVYKSLCEVSPNKKLILKGATDTDI